MPSALKLVNLRIVIIGSAPIQRLNWQPSTRWSKKLGLVSSSMWVICVAFVSIVVAPWREELPVLVVRSGGISGKKLMLVGLACLVIVFVRVVCGPSDECPKGSDEQKYPEYEAANHEYSGEHMVVGQSGYR